MSLSVDGVWKAGVWATTVWADGVWSEGAVQPQVQTSGGGGYSRYLHWAPDNYQQPKKKRKLTQAEEQELVVLVRKAIDEDDQKARKKLEALARKYKDFENSLASFSEAFQAMSQTNRQRFEQHRITTLKYQAEKQEIEEEETIILHLLRNLH